MSDAASNPAPRAIIIAGPNGAGKTTFAREFRTNPAGEPARPAPHADCNTPNSRLARKTAAEQARPSGDLP